MIIEAIKDIKSRTGCSRVAIFKFIKDKYDIGDEKRAAKWLSLALKKGLESGLFKMARDEGKNSNKYKLGENALSKPKKKMDGGPKKKANAKKANAPAVVKKSVASKSKEKASAKRNSIGTPKIKKPIKKAAATSKVKGGASGKADKATKGGKKPAAKATGTTKKASAATKKTASAAKPKKASTGKATAKK